jgi:hypothetical protein
MPFLSLPVCVVASLLIGSVTHKSMSELYFKHTFRCYEDVVEKFETYNTEKGCDAALKSLKADTEEGKPDFDQTAEVLAFLSEHLPAENSNNIERQATA